MSTLLLPFAKRITDDQLVTATEVPRGAACNCVCPGCGTTLLARQGTEREWHFAHTKALDCADGYEKSVHELAKQLIRQRKQLLLPVLEAVASDIDAYGHTVVERLRISDPRTVQLEDCRSSHKRDDVTPDLTGVLKGREILVEVTVFHRLMPEKHERILATSLPSFQIDLSVFQTQQATKERLEEELFENASNRHWLWHPKLDEALAKLHEQVAETLKRRRQEWEEDQKNRPPPSPVATWRSAPRGNSPDLTRDRMWRAGLPAQEQIVDAAKALALRTGRAEARILEKTAAITSRGDLVDLTPADLAKQWGEHLRIGESEVAIFLVEAGYVLML